MVGRKVKFLKYEANPHNIRTCIDEIPIGKPITISLITPAKKTKPYPNMAGFFKIQPY